MRQTLLSFAVLASLNMLMVSTAAAGDLTKAEEKEGFVSLCDGKTLAGWTGDVDGYTVEDGVIACRPDSGGNLYTAKDYADFVLRFEFQLQAGSNNGIGLRVPEGGHAAYDGMEIQVLDNTAQRYANLQPYQYHGSVYGIIPAKRGYLMPIGAWNSEEIRCVGRHVKVTLNGEVIVDGDLDVASAGGTMDHKDHPGLTRTTGHLVLCGHRSDVRFRKLRVKEVTGEAE